MKKTTLFILSWAILALLVSSCSKTEPVPKGEFATGVFIVNEGNFSEANGSVGFYNVSTNEAKQDIFAEVNGVATGGLIQSVYFYANMAFIIDQLGNRIEVVEAETFKSIATINEGLSTPRYMTVANGKGYVSNWGPFDQNYDLPDSYVAVIDFATFTVSKTIPAGNGTEGMFTYNNAVLAANSYAATIQEIDAGTDAITRTFEVAEGPVGFAEDKDGKVWVLSNSFFSGSALTQLDITTGSVLKSFPVGASAKSLTINAAGDQLYYLSAPFLADAAVKTLSIDAAEDAGSALITAANLYGLGIDPKTGIIYVGNHNGFQGNGTVLRYEGSTLLDSFAAGVAPNGFVFR